MKLQSRNTQTHASAFVLNLLAFGASIAGGILCDFNSSFRNYCFGLAVVAFFGAVFSIMACRLEKKSNSIARAFWGDKLED
jgi:multidrug transporter EmrE-like cation transporter